MTSPQLENGYVKIATEIYDAFAKIRIPGEARQLLDFIIRKTYGYHKKEDFISLSQFVLGTGLKRPNVVRGLKKLLEMKLIIKSDTTLINSYRFNKHYCDWGGGIVSDTGGIKSVAKVVSEAIHTKDNIQKIISHASFQKKSVNNKNMKIYDEDDPGTSFSEDFREINPPKKEASQIGANMTAMIKWAIQRRGGRPFVNIQKQRSALKKMRIAKIGPTAIKERWEEMENDHFWKDKGFDFMSLAGTFDKKPNE